MCGRYQLNKLPRDLRDLFPKNWRWRFPGHLGLPRYNIAPQQDVPVVRRIDAQPTANALRWGFRPAHWNKGKFQINARSESVFDKPMFRDAARDRRALVPATGWYEWQGPRPPKQPYLFHYPDKELFMLAGIWTPTSDPDEPDGFAILTVPATGVAEPIHDRMPAIVSPEQYDLWLDGDLDATGAMALYQDPGRSNLVASAVSKVVGDPKNDGPECETPVEATGWLL